MKCSSCGAEMPEGYSFCTKCGARLLRSEKREAGLSPGVVILIAVLLLSIILTLMLAMGVIKFGESDAESEEPTPAPSADVYSQTAPETGLDVGLQSVDDLTADGEAATGESPYLLPDSASRYLSVSDISGLTWEQLCFARNEIFARHGLFFDVPEIDAYFQAQSWYSEKVSIYDYGFDDLNAEEIANAALIADYENSKFGGSYY